jgi:hypothetical protein
MHVLLNVNKEFRFDHYAHISALQKENKIHVRKKVKERHEQAEASTNHCINHEKLELL